MVKYYRKTIQNDTSERWMMGFCYDKLWKKLIDEKMNKLDLQRAIKTTPRTIAKMGRDENVSMEILGRICIYFKCDISEIIEFKMEGNNA